MINLAIKTQKKAKSEKGALDKSLAYKNELARLSFRTEELDHFYETRMWIEKGVNHFKYNHTIRPQTLEELRNVAVAHVKERWRTYKRAGDSITGGLVLQMTMTCLKKYIAKDNTILSHPHPERMTKKEDQNPFAKIAERNPSRKDRQHQEDLRIDIKNLERDCLTLEGRIVLDCKQSEDTNAEIKFILEALGHRSVQHLLYKEIEAIIKLLIGKGYP